MRIERVGQANHFDFIRLALAVLVIASHSFALGTGSELHEPLVVWTNGQVSFGALAVNCFFVMSGLLIAASADRSPSLKDFFGKRVARIYPAFLACALVTVLVLVPISSARLPSNSVLGRAADVLQQTLRLREFHYVNAFAKNPFPDVINGSIWSIQYEFWCYVGVAVFAVAGLLRRRGIVLLLFLASVVFSVVAEKWSWPLHGGPLVTLFGLPQYWARLAPMYLAGVVFYLYRGSISLRKGGAAVAVAALIAACLWRSGWTWVFPFAGTYLIFYLAYVPKSALQRFGKFGDFSYGTYLYAFPIQQVIVLKIGQAVHPWLLFLLATPLTLLAAVASWYGIERRFLKANRRKETPVHAVERAEIPKAKAMHPAVSD